MNEKAFRRSLLLSFLFGLLATISLSGCYMSGQITNINDDSSFLPGVSLKPAGTEFVSGSGQFKNTPIRNYKSLSSVGSFQSQVIQTSPNGYKMFSSVQGVVASKGVQ